MMGNQNAANELQSLLTGMASATSQSAPAQGASGSMP